MPDVAPVTTTRLPTIDRGAGSAGHHRRRICDPSLVYPRKTERSSTSSIAPVALAAIAEVSMPVEPSLRSGERSGQAMIGLCRRNRPMRRNKSTTEGWPAIGYHQRSAPSAIGDIG